MGDVIEILTTATNTVEVEAQGPQGIPGVGVPTGGSTGQVLRKKTGTDYDTEWAAAGSGSGSVTSVALASTDLTISGSPITDSGTITANIAANAVTLEKLQTISSEHLLGRHGSGNGGVQQIGLGTGLAISGSNVRVATTGITAGTYTKLTIDETGRATVGATASSADVGAAAISHTHTLSEVTDAFSTTIATIDAGNALITLAAKRSQYVRLNVSENGTLRLPQTGVAIGDTVEVIAGSAVAGKTLTVEKYGAGNTLESIATITVAGAPRLFRALSDQSYGWVEVNYFTTSGGIGAPSVHTHAASAIVSGSFGNISFDGKIGSTAGLPVVTTTAGAVTTLALGTANQVLRVNSGATGVEFADPAASGVTGAAASASDVLGVSGANITGVDANADRLVFWDDSASKLTYLEAGSGLTISGTVMTASGGASINQAIAVGFVLN